MIPGARPVVLAAGLAILLPGAASASPRGAAPSAGGAPVPGELVVGFERGASGSERARARRAAGVSVKRATRLAGVQVLELAPGESAAGAIARLEADPDVAFAQPNRWRTVASRVPSDPLFGQLWGLAAIDAPQAWDLFTGGDPLVAVVDEGVEYDHPDLAPNMWTNPGEVAGNGADDDGNGIADDVHGADVFSGDGDPRDAGGHGTHVAGTIAARGDNGLGIAGVTWRARLMAVRALGPSGADDATVAEGFDYAADMGARIVNASLGGPGESPVMREAFERHPDTLFVVAAGNDGSDNDAAANAPCTESSENLICVAATTPSEDLASFSNFGATTVDIAAPGTIVLSAGRGRTRFTDGFEADDFASRWDAHVESGGGAAWGRAGPGAASGTSIADSPAGDYASNVATYADLADPLSLSGASGCVLHFNARIALGAGDRFVVDRSVNGGSFQRRLTRATSTGGTFRPFEVPLAADNQSTVRFGFGVESDGAGVADGASVDDVSVRCAQSAAGEPAFVFQDGTSMASPHVAGAAALLLGRKPALTVAGLRAALLGTGDAVPALAGRTVTGRRLNVDKALRSIEPAPTATPTPTATATATPDTGSGTQGGGGTTTTTTTDDSAPTGKPTSLRARARAARVTCTRARGRLRCKVTRAGAVSVRIVVRRGKRVVARGTGRAGRRIALRGGKPRAGRHTIVVTLLEGDRRASSTKRIRIR